MRNFIHGMTGVRGNHVADETVLLGVSVRMLPEQISTKIGRLSKEDCLS